MSAIDLKVLLVHPPSQRFDKTLDYLQSEFASVAAYLQEQPRINLKTSAAGLLNLSLKTIIREVISHKPEIIILFVDVCETQVGMRLAKLCKEIAPGAKVVIFGDAAIWIPQYFARHPFDALVTSGDQELVLADYLRAVQNSQRPAHGMTFSDGDEFVSTPAGHLLSPDEWPFPSDQVIDYESYHVARQLRGEVTDDLSFTVSKGCHVGCVWCIDPYKNGRKHRRRPVSQTVDYMESSLGKFDMFQLHSPIFTSDKEWVSNFIAEMKRRNLYIPFKFVTLVGEMADPKLCQSLQEIGLKAVGMGIESLSVARRFTTKFHEYKLPTVAHNLERCHIQGVCYTQVGLEYQKREDIYYTHRRLLDLGLSLRPTGATPFHKLTTKTVEELDAIDLSEYDRKSFYNPDCGISKEEFFSILVDPHNYHYEDLLKPIKCLNP